MVEFDEVNAVGEQRGIRQTRYHRVAAGRRHVGGHALISQHNL